MGLMDSIGKGMMGQLAGQFGGGGQQNKLIGAAAKLIGSTGGLGALTQMFAQRGHADTVNSWVSTDKNRDIAPNDVQDVLGQNRIREVANDAGVSEQEASSGLSSILPQLVDKLTPDGKLPDDNTEKNALSQLAGHFLGGSKQ